MLHIKLQFIYHILILNRKVIQILSKTAIEQFVKISSHPKSQPFAYPATISCLQSRISLHPLLNVNYMINRVLLHFVVQCWQRRKIFLHCLCSVYSGLCCESHLCTCIQISFLVAFQAGLSWALASIYQLYF